MILYRADFLFTGIATRQHLLVRNPSFPSPAPRTPRMLLGLSGTLAKLFSSSPLAPLLFLPYRFATAPYVPVSVPNNCFLLMVQGFPPALFVPEIKLTALGVPPRQSAFWLMFGAHCPVLPNTHEEHPALKRSTDCPALPCCLFLSHLRTPLEALDFIHPHPGKQPSETLCEGSVTQTADARRAAAAATSQAPGRPLPVPADGLATIWDGGLDACAGQALPLNSPRQTFSQPSPAARSQMVALRWFLPGQMPCSLE